MFVDWLGSAPSCLRRASTATIHRDRPCLVCPPSLVLPIYAYFAYDAYTTTTSSPPHDDSTGKPPEGSSAVIDIIAVVVVCCCCCHCMATIHFNGSSNNSNKRRRRTLPCGGRAAAVFVDGGRYSDSCHCHCRHEEVAEDGTSNKAVHQSLDSPRWRH
jgi:hypothetical protein